MTSRDFCFWLQGYLEINAAFNQQSPAPLSQGQVDCIQRHLSLVFKHEIDPSYSGDAKTQAELQSIHDGRPKIGGVNASGQFLRC